MADAPRSGGWFGEVRPVADGGRRGRTASTGTGVAPDGGPAPDRRPVQPAAGSTRAGLPRRIPKAQFGADQARATEPPSPGAGAPPRPTRSADAVRGRLEQYQHGVRRGRRPDDDKA